VTVRLWIYTPGALPSVRAMASLSQMNILSGSSHPIHLVQNVM